MGLPHEKVINRTALLKAHANGETIRLDGHTWHVVEVSNNVPHWGDMVTEIKIRRKGGIYRVFKFQKSENPTEFTSAPRIPGQEPYVQPTRSMDSTWADCPFVLNAMVDYGGG